MKKTFHSLSDNFQLSKMSIKLITLTLLFFNPCFVIELTPCKTAPYNHLCKLQDDYDKTKVPGNLPLTLTPFTANIMDVTEVNVIEGYITICLLLLIDWKDPNLTFNPTNLT